MRTLEEFSVLVRETRYWAAEGNEVEEWMTIFPFCRNYNKFSVICRPMASSGIDKIPSKKIMNSESKNFEEL